MNKLLTAGLAIGTLIFSAGQAKAGNLVIDTFNTQFQSVEVEVPLEGDVDFSLLRDDETSGLSSSIVGGYRNIFVEMIDATTRGSEAEASVAQEIAVTNGLLAISNDTGVKSNTIVTWDSNGESLGIDLLNNGYDTNAFDLDIVSIDLDANLMFTVMGNNGETATLSQSGLSPVGDNLFHYEDFDVSNGTYTDIFSDVKSIALKVSGQDLDASFDSLNAIDDDPTDPEPSAVPEPTSVLSLLSIIGFGANCVKGKASKK